MTSVGIWECSEQLSCYLFMDTFSNDTRNPANNIPLLSVLYDEDPAYPSLFIDYYLPIF